MVVGVACTAAYVALYAALRTRLPGDLANLVATALRFTILRRVVRDTEALSR